MLIPNYYSSDDFEEKYTYQGELGFKWSKEKTFFRLWAPTASETKIRFYKSGDPNRNDLTEEISMKKDVCGTWIAEKSGNLNGVYYTFVTVVEESEHEAPDPYARALGVNGKRSMVIDLESTNPENWESDRGVFYGRGITDAVLYELHIRDLSMDEGSGIENKGKYLGVTEENTKTKSGIATGIDHIKELGVTHIHFLPIADYGSVDESADRPRFNWGYDPMNFNVPEGSYSSSAENGEVRIKEMKEMIYALHKNGIGVVMDMVYNHVFHADEFSINMLVPGYFSRIDESGVYSDGSGCGNDTASERSMVKKYIVDSVKYWADEYHIDGFRFDLSGLLDIATMNEITKTVHPIHPNVIFYCEGWNMNTKVTKPVVELANQYNSEKMPGCSFFSDTIRNLLIGGSYGSDDKGLVTGKKCDENLLRQCFRGMPSWCKTPSKSVNYVSCHDGLTLYDKISSVFPNADSDEKLRRNFLAAAVYMLSQGVPFMQAGEEMLRSKVKSDGSFEHNSYNSPDSVNSIKWNDLEKIENKATFEYYKGLIRFRKAHSALRMKTAEDVYSHITDVDTDIEGVSAFHIWGNVNGEEAQAIFVAFNFENELKEIQLPIGKWSVRIFDKCAGNEHIFFAENKIALPPLSAAAMVK